MSEEKKKEKNGGTGPLTFQIIIEFQPETQSIQVQGPMGQPIVFVGMLEMAKSIVQRNLSSGKEKKGESPILTLH